MESRRNGPQLSSRHDDDDDDGLSVRSLGGVSTALLSPQSKRATGDRKRKTALRVASLPRRLVSVSGHVLAYHVTGLWRGGWSSYWQSSDYLNRHARPVGGH